MYIVLVGPPAARKGTAMYVGRGFLDAIGIRVSADESSRQKLITSLADKSTNDGDVWHCSMTIHSSELTVFLGYQSRELLGMLQKWYDCENTFVYDTHARGEEEISNVWVNLMGATTPDQLRDALPEGAVGSGFTSRVCFIFASNKGKLVLKPTLVASLEQGLTEELSRIRNLVGEFHIHSDAEERYYVWRKEGESRGNTTNPKLDYYTQRRPAHLFKLAMIHSAAESDDMSVSLGMMEESIRVLEEAEKFMPFVFAGVGANPLAAVQLRLKTLLEERNEMKMSEVASIFFSDATHSQLGEIVASLEQMGLVEIDTKARKLKLRRRKKRDE
jgi:hypothetical protein